MGFNFTDDQVIWLRGWIDAIESHFKTLNDFRAELYQILKQDEEETKE